MSVTERLLAVLGQVDGEIAETETRANTAEAAAAELAETVADRDITIDALRVLVAELEARIKELEHPPTGTVFGADATGTSATGQANVLTKWGDGAAIRQFFTGFGQVAPRDRRASVVHASWKPASLGVITDAAVTAATANLLPGDCVEVWHESDKKVRDGVYTHVEALARKNRFYDTVKRVRPDLLVVNTLTGWEAEPGNSTTRGNIDKWAAVKADLLGLDCDGIHGWPYTNYDGEIAAAVAFVEKFPAYKGWCVPEFGTSRHTNDQSGATRAQWATTTAAKFKAAGAAYVCLYEFESTPGNAFTTPAELAAWRSLI
jgi:hypothetical protein